ncbi:MAG: histidinol-phosphatase HisJ family protein [Oscillospiraceae bacterium]
MKIINCHNHSDYSFDIDDGKNPIEKMCKEAANNGIFAFAITDHCECNLFNEHKCETIIPLSIQKTNSLKGKYSNTEIISGVELGQALQSPKNAEFITNIPNLDFIIGSLHNANGDKDFYDVDFNCEKTTLKKLYENYYTELFSMAKSTEYDVIGHITYPFRYYQQAVDKGIIKAGLLNFSEFDEMIFETMKSAIGRGKGIELNTSKLDLTINGQLLSQKYLTMYKQIGGEILSIGSDAHEPCNVTRNLIEGHNLAKNIGFKYITYFKKRKPIMEKLIDL